MKLTYVACLGACIIFQSQIAEAQNTFMKLYGGVDEDWFEMAVPAGDGNYMTLYNTGDVWGGPNSVGLVKFDNSGNILWTKAYNNIIDETGYSLQKTPDNGFVVAGSGKYCVEANCGTDGFVFKTDANGAVQLSRGIGETSFDWGNRAIQTADGGYAIGMETASIGSGGVTAIVRLNSNGDTLWTRSFQDEGPISSGGQNCQSVIETTDGGFLVGGNYRLDNISQFHTFVVKLNSAGTLQWAKVYVDGLSGSTEVHDMQEMSNGDIAILTRSNIIRTNSSGDLQWAKSYPGFVARYGQEGYATFSETTDGGLVMAGGFVESSQTNPAIVKVSATGDVHWVQEYHSGYVGAAFSAVQLSTGGYLISGMITGIGAGGTDGFVGVTDVLGVINGCSAAKSITPTTANITPTPVTPLMDAGLRSVVNAFSEQTLSGSLTDSYTCTAAVGIDEENAAQEFQLFPNPATSEVTIVVNEPQTITLHNALGKQVITKAVTTTTATLPVQHLAAGIYYLHADKQVKKLVIQ